MPAHQSSLRWALGLLALVLTFSSVLADTAGCGKSATLTSGTKTMTVNGKSRRWIVRLPSNYDNKKPHRLVFGVHWRDADYQAVDGGSAPYYGLKAKMGTDTIFVAPDGLNKGWANSGGEDITFFDQIIKAVSDDLCINEKLIFSLGFSYGGAMSYSLACSRPKVVRAVAVLSGAQLSGCATTSDPVVRPFLLEPLLRTALTEPSQAYYQQHGVRDSVLNLSMGKSLRDSMLRRNGCASKTAGEPARNSRQRTKTTYECKAEYPTVFTAFDGDHVALPNDSGSDGGANSWTINEVYTFFNQFK